MPDSILPLSPYREDTIPSHCTLPLLQPTLPDAQSTLARYPERITHSIELLLQFQTNYCTIPATLSDTLLPGSRLPISLYVFFRL